jgi:cytidylate kinase
MIISISGTAGSGKSTVAKRLAKALGWPYYGMGKLRREAALKKGLTLEEYNKLGEEDPTTDKDADLYQEELGKTQDNFIVEGRTSYYFIPQSFKVFITVDERTGAERVWSELQKENERNEGKNLITIEDVLRSHEQRKESDMLRYKKYYGIENAYNPANFDLVIDTTNLSPDQTFARVSGALKQLDKSLPL